MPTQDHITKLLQQAYELHMKTRQSIFAAAPRIREADALCEALAPHLPAESSATTLTMICSDGEVWVWVSVFMDTDATCAAIKAADLVIEHIEYADQPNHYDRIVLRDCAVYVSATPVKAARKAA